MPPKKENVAVDGSSCFDSNRPSFRDVEEALIKFSGDDTYSIVKWVEDLEEMATVLKWSDVEKLIFGKRLLTGTAALFIRSEKGIIRW